MDPKLSQTDPKIQEAYDRVMSGSPTPVVGGAVPSSPAPQPVVPAQPVAPVSPQPTAPVTPAPAQPQAQAASPMGSTIAFNANNAGKNQGTTVKRGGSKIMPLIMGLGIIVLLVAYTFVWIYVFKLKIPGLPF